MENHRIWPANNGAALVAFEKENAVFVLIRGNFNDVADWAVAGIAMAGTATEQLVCVEYPCLQECVKHSCYHPLLII